MPWTIEDYPPSMKDLPSLVREKAILIANALLDAGHSEDQSIRIAIGRTKAWAEQRGMIDGSDLGT